MAKFCKDCRYFIPAERVSRNLIRTLPSMGATMPRCAHPEVANVVTGDQIPCEVARFSGCGPEGRLYEEAR